MVIDGCGDIVRKSCVLRWGNWDTADSCVRKKMGGAQIELVYSGGVSPGGSSLLFSFSGSGRMWSGNIPEPLQSTQSGKPW